MGRALRKITKNDKDFKDWIYEKACIIDNKIIVKTDEYWKRFYQLEHFINKENIPNCGKWMYFFKMGDWKVIDNIILKAMELEICESIKRTADFKSAYEHNIMLNKNLYTGDPDDYGGVVCFYLSIDDMDSHKKVIQFFLDNDLIRTTKTGKLYNISFKLDEQTLSLEYSSNGKYKAKLTLSDILDLETREWKV